MNCQVALKKKLMAISKQKIEEKSTNKVNKLKFKYNTNLIYIYKIFIYRK